MTKKEFKAAIKRGLGRCVLAVKEDREKYRDIVLWACRRDISYDAQCEGSRAWYIYTMASCYPDKETFIQAAGEALRKYRSDTGWDLLHFSELLMYFALEGSGSARAALEDKYRELLADMQRRTRRPKGVFHELSNLEVLGLVLTVDKASFLRVAGDFGRLYLEKSYMLSGDFAWYFSSKGGQYKRTLEWAAKKDETIACFLEREQAGIAAREAARAQRKPRLPETLSGILLSRWLSKNADGAALERYALAYREETHPPLRAKALSAFARCPYPDDPLPIIEDTQSTCDELRSAAWAALESLRHRDVRTFALTNAARGIRTPENFALLATNYMPQDRQLLENLLGELIAAGDWDGVHEAGLDIIRTRELEIPQPKHLLPLLYEYDPCSVCRESVLMCMSRHRMLTKELLEECLYDSSDDIRAYAARALRRRAQR